MFKDLDLSAFGAYKITTYGEHELNVIPETYLSTFQFFFEKKLFDTLVDLTVVDYLTYRSNQWTVQQATATGFSRAVHQQQLYDAHKDKRFSVVVHLLSYLHNVRVRIKCPVNANLSLPSLVDLIPCANWFEREAFDLFGIIFIGHPDLRRLLTDYGFIGHPFRKDYPLIGESEIRFDGSQKSCVYEPVSIEERTLVPKVIREIRYS